MTFRTRFAPSPTGPLHLGHAYSALLAWDMALENNGEFLLRIEDIDKGRARPEWEAQIYEDLKWLGLSWPEPIMRQSDRQATYDSALDALWLRGLLYPCICSRRDIENAASAPQEGAPIHGPDGIVYPGTCRSDGLYQRNFPEDHRRPKGVTLRLDMSRAVTYVESLVGGVNMPSLACFSELGQGPMGQKGQISFSPEEIEENIGDIVMARRDMGTSYHLSVVLDDAQQGITHVVRGADLFEATKIHVFLQTLLELPTPAYHHHRLIRDENGKRLAKRDDARAISLYRREGVTSDHIRLKTVI